MIRHLAISVEQRLVTDGCTVRQTRRQLIPALAHVTRVTKMVIFVNNKQQHEEKTENTLIVS